MVIQHKITMDLTTSSRPEQVEVVQDDKYSRDLLISLYAGGVAWTIPAGTTAVVYFEKSDGTGGSYDKLPDKTPAASCTGNVIRVRLAPQVCTVAGPVRLAVTLVNGSNELTTFRVGINVQAKPGINAKSEDYINVSGYVPASGWNSNKYLGTDADGNVVELETPEFAKPTDEQVQNAVDEYLDENPIPGATDDQIQAAVDDYLTRNPIQGGMTDDERVQLEKNTQDIAANASAIAANTATINRRVAKAKFSLSGNAITVDRTFQDGGSSSGVLALDESGVPESFTEGGVESVLEFEGFGDEFLDLWEGGSY